MRVCGYVPKEKGGKRQAIRGFKPRTLDKGRGGGLVVSALAFYSDDPSLNPAGY